MARICRRKSEVMLVVEEIIFEIVFMLMVVLSRYRNTGQIRGLNVGRLRRYRMADRIPHQIEHMSELVEMSDADCFDNLRMGCLGALDGTLIDVTVPEIDKARYRTRKGTISVNVLAACDRGMHFIYMLAGWEGSAADARVLRDAIARDDGLRVPHVIDLSWPSTSV
ncbi:hypothetical protein ACS0TY_003190 [Phlomoides rotata]